MIDVTVFTGLGQYTGIVMSGHAGYPQEEGCLEGQELVCAAVSALALNMANCVEHFTDDMFEAKVDAKAGYFSFQFQEVRNISEKAALLINSLVFGLEDLAGNYGEPYIQIRFQEVQGNV